MGRVILIGFEGAQTLDVTGPSEVFSVAARMARRPLYRVRFASPRGGTVHTTSGLAIRTDDLRKIRPRADDVVVVSGGNEEGVGAAARDERLRAWIQRAHGVVRRLASVCSGAFVLAGAGVLDGRRAATHWSSCDRLAAMHPEVTVDRNAIFVDEGDVWTSAGVTTGIDMALAMVERDHGRKLADAVAARLVLYVRRQGFQSQFSDALVAQASSSNPLGPAIAWARANLAAADVAGLARHTGLSARTFHRRCADHLSTTPAKLLEKLRVEHARTLLATSSAPVKTLAVDCGFATPARMKRAFRRELGVGPSEYRTLARR